MVKKYLWNSNGIENLNGKIALITGSSEGLGFEVAKQLASKDLFVILTGRKANKGERAISQIKSEFPESNIVFKALDLANLQNIRDFASDIAKNYDHIDILVNNAGIMTPPAKQFTADGFELQFGTNHLGHYYLTRLLLPLLSKSEKARVVAVSTPIVQSYVKLDFNNLQAEVNYNAFKIYQYSKMANLIFCAELQNYCDKLGYNNIISCGSHPGVAKTNLLVNANNGVMPNQYQFMFGKIDWRQSVQMGALPLLYAATKGVKLGYYVPNGFLEMRGYVKQSKLKNYPITIANSNKLWELCEKLITDKGFNFETLL